MDDFKAFRDFAAGALSAEAEIEVVAQAASGREGIEAVCAHMPDLVVLDIGLPDLCGIDVAHVVRKSAPQTRIVFLTQMSTPEVIAAAMETGAMAYVVKQNAHSDFLRAVRAALAGEQFVSNTLD
ncbi:response regulator [Candidatus Korobacter versatilis]|uniref:response regulator n=1 Tax=Candidatus Korobacter versatilis TaxID=658062 RepID=UPI00031FE119|nr:response regulator transcription factor [Candidatus Koribacter versatilis]